MGAVRVTILPDRRVEDMEPATVAEVLKRLGLHPDAHLVVRGEEILTRDVRLRADDAVEVIPVISGGRPPRSSGRWPARNCAGPAGRVGVLV